MLDIRFLDDYFFCFETQLSNLSFRQRLAFSQLSDLSRHELALCSRKRGGRGSVLIKIARRSHGEENCFCGDENRVIYGTPADGSNLDQHFWPQKLIAGKPAACTALSTLAQTYIYRFGYNVSFQEPIL